MNDIRKDEDQVQRIIDQLKLEGWATLIGPVQKELATVLAQSGKQILKQLELGNDSEIFHLVDQAALKFAQKRAAEMVGKRVLADGSIVENPNAAWAISEATRDMLRGEVANALEQGLSIGELREKIISSYAFSSERALNIARSEVAKAHGVGGLAAAKASGVVKTKTALLGSEHAQPDDCDLNADAGAISIDDDFPSGDSEAEGIHPACVCSTRYGTE